MTLPHDVARCHGIEVKDQDLPAAYCRDCMRYLATLYDPPGRMHVYMTPAVVAEGAPPSCFRCKDRIEE